MGHLYFVSALFSFILNQTFSRLSMMFFMNACAVFGTYAFKNVTISHLDQFLFRGDPNWENANFLSLTFVSRIGLKPNDHESCWIIYKPLNWFLLISLVSKDLAIDISERCSLNEDKKINVYSWIFKIFLSRQSWAKI